MFDLAKLIRTDRKLTINETRIRQEVARVMDLERDIANVSTDAFFFFPLAAEEAWMVCHI